jgi:hypothetical protein
LLRAALGDLVGDEIAERIVTAAAVVVAKEAGRQRAGVPLGVGLLGPVRDVAVLVEVADALVAAVALAPFLKLGGI